MKVTVEIKDYSNPAKFPIRVHNAWGDGSKVEVDVAGERYFVDGAELISAVQRCLLDALGR